MALKLVIVFTFFFATILSASSIRVDSIQNSTTINGNKSHSAFDEAPWLVSIRINGVHYCSGAIISRDWIITSAQCIVDIASMKSKVTILTGRSSIYNNGGVYKVITTKVHDHYKLIECNLPIYDIGLIQIWGEFDFDGAHAPKIIALNGSYKASPDEEFNVSNWNQQFVGYKINIDLKFNRWTIMRKQQCLEYYSVVNDDLRSDKVFCGVNSEVYLENPCVMGDLGSPVVNDGKLVGIKSYRSDCQLFLHSPSLFTHLKYYGSWIKNISGVTMS